MPYADAEYYQGDYGGSVIPIAELTRQLSKASDQIDSMTYNRIVAVGFEALTPFQQGRVKKAVCAQAEYVYQYGAYLDAPLSGYSAGSISLTLNVIETNGVKTSNEVVNLLKTTGLTDRGL